MVVEDCIGGDMTSKSMGEGRSQGPFRVREQCACVSPSLLTIRVHTFWECGLSGFSNGAYFLEARLKCAVMGNLYQLEDLKAYLQCLLGRSM